eukprot:1278785-Pyramimonas_sp.AAC.1
MLALPGLVLGFPGLVLGFPGSVLGFPGLVPGIPSLVLALPGLVGAGGLSRVLACSSASRSPPSPARASVSRTPRSCAALHRAATMSR